MTFCKKIDGKFYCTAKNRKQQFSCSAGKIDQFDDHCQYGLNICLIGRLIEIDKETLDEEARI